VEQRTPIFFSVIDNFFTSYLPIDLQELESVALLDRREEKFLIPNKWCANIAESLDSEYNILEINNERKFRYDNLYFDTPGNICLEDHLRGRKIRYKVRIRSYANSNISFLEVKSRNVHGRSIKMRLQRTSEKWDSPLTKEERRFLTERVSFARELSPVLYSSYSRFTLAHIKRGERITFDTGLKFKSIEGVVFYPLDGLSIVELKQGESDRHSPLHKLFRSHPNRHVPLGRTIRISKYVVGRLSTDTSLHARTYFESLRELNRASKSAQIS